MGTHHVDSYEAHKGSGDQISPVISHDDEDIRFQDFDEEAFEKELEADVLALFLYFSRWLCFIFLRAGLHRHIYEVGLTH